MSVIQPVYLDNYDIRIINTKKNKSLKISPFKSKKARKNLKLRIMREKSNTFCVA